MENDLSEIKNAISILTTEVISLHQEMRYGFKDLEQKIIDGDNRVLETLRGEMHCGFEGLHQEIVDGDNKIIDTLRNEMNERFDKQDIKFEMLQRSVDGLRKEMHQKFKEEKQERTNDIKKIVNIKR